MKKQEYAERLKFEHELINRRVTWLMASQSIFFAAYGLALEKDEARFFLRFIPVVGSIISILVLIGILAAFTAKYLTWQKFKKQQGNEKEPFWVNTWTTYIGFVPDFTLPLVFIYSWWFLYNLA